MTIAWRRNQEDTDTGAASPDTEAEKCWKKKKQLTNTKIACSWAPDALLTACCILLNVFICVVLSTPRIIYKDIKENKKQFRLQNLI